MHVCEWQQNIHDQKKEKHNNNNNNPTMLLLLLTKTIGQMSEIEQKNKIHSKLNEASIVFSSQINVIIRMKINSISSFEEISICLLFVVAAAVAATVVDFTICTVNIIVFLSNRNGAAVKHTAVCTTYIKTQIDLTVRHWPWWSSTLNGFSFELVCLSFFPFFVSMVFFVVVFVVVRLRWATGSDLITS